MEAQEVPATQRVLIESLVDLLGREDRPVRLFETHISWVLVTADIAYKFKKALRYEFLDFSTLSARHHYCMEELRLNRRFSPMLYLDLVCIAGTPEAPSIDGAGAPIEYGVKMRAFPQSALWSQRLAIDAITVAEVDALAGKVAQFHKHAAVAPDSSGWGSPDAIRTAAVENLSEIAAIAATGSAKALGDVMAWQAEQCQRLAGAFESRKARGFIRECHADLHSANILTLQGEVCVFDCIEFNESLRWIDVIDDLSFACMDLAYRQRRDLAARLLNQYLALTGDYEGLGVLRFYRTQRALVRCKVALLRETQRCRGEVGASEELSESQRYLQCALESARRCSPLVMIMHGFSGSGKSTLARQLVELFDAVALRSDVERKRMLGLNPRTRAGAAPDAGAYDRSTTQRTYCRLHQLARRVVNAGLPVVVDAAFLKRPQRDLFNELAKELGAPFFILNMQTDECNMRERIISRSNQQQDPSDAGPETLAHQLATYDPLAEDEQKYVINISGEWDMNDGSLQRALAPVSDTLGTRPPP